jgi:bifunctional DNA-binding transcriptional regulator/antitoxin component of YhaV-PrlF toxin-antitoxin module
MGAVSAAWYAHDMSGTYTMSVGDRGRVVLPAELRHAKGWVEGTLLIAYETEQGVVIATRDEILRRVRAQLVGAPSLVDELLAERRSAAAEEDK